MSDESIISPSDALDAAAAFDYAASIYNNLFKDPIHITITLGAVPCSEYLYTTLYYYYDSIAYSDLKQYLSDEITSADDALAFASLPSVNDSIPDKHMLMSAQAKALGIIPDDELEDGVYLICTRAGNYSFDPAARGIPNKFDFIGLALRGIGEIIGRMSGIGITANPTKDFGTLDLFRFRAPGVHDVTDSENTYFSIDSGMTNLKNFDFPNGTGTSALAWKNIENHSDVFDTYFSFDMQAEFSPIDIQSLDIVGFDLTAKPSPKQGKASITNNFQRLDKMLGEGQFYLK